MKRTTPRHIIPEQLKISEKDKKKKRSFLKQPEERERKKRHVMCKEWHISETI